jgi:hypothetical protein
VRAEVGTGERVIKPLTVTGVKEMIRRISVIRQKFPNEIGRALRQEIELEATEAKRRTPVDRGNLRASIHVKGPEVSGRRIWCRIVAGGNAAPYAIYVHENLEANHDSPPFSGGQAKFIESVILESAPHMPARIAARVKSNRQSGYVG